MKKILFCFPVFLCLLLAVGCKKDSEVQYSLTYTAGENGTIEGSRSQMIQHGRDGSPVTAVPADGYHFAGWSDGINTAGRTESNVMSDLAVTAEFSLNKYTLTYTAGKNGTITGTSIQTVNHGEDGSPVTGVPAKHYHFTGWSDGVAAAGRTDSNITADLEVKAIFAVDKYKLLYKADENGSIEGVSSQVVDHGGNGSPVMAIPVAGYHWTLNSNSLVLVVYLVFANVWMDLHMGPVVHGQRIGPI